MKTRALDFLLSGICIGLIAAVSLLLIGALVAPYSSALLGQYHVVADVFALFLTYGLASAIFVRLMLRLSPLRPGDYSMDHPHFTYWKVFTVVYELGRFALAPFTIVFAKPAIIALFGARVGRNTAFAGHVNEPPLISIGDDAILGQDCVVTAHVITSGHIILREIKIAKGATVGINAVIMPGVEIGDGAVVASCSVVAMGTRIPAGELWGGVPARKIKDLALSDIRG